MSIIRVDNLGKRYTIGHDRRAGGMFRYASLRDTLAHQVRALWQRARHPLSPNRENTDLEEFWALRDLAFEIQPGERVGIIGRNGAGKSTLLKLLSRITEPTTGRIELNGRIASLLEVGTGFHPELTGRENIYLNGAILGMTRAEIKAKFDQIVDFAEVEKFLDTPVKRYSSGMYVRLAFAVAAHLEPEILLVDEVLAVGDASFQKKCLGKMEDVARNEGRTILFVSHNMAAIKRLCRRCAHLDSGMLNYWGDVAGAINRYERGSKETAGRLTFTPRASGNPAIELTRVSLANVSGTAVFDLSEPVMVEVEFLIKSTIARLNLHLLLKKEGANVLLSFDSDLHRERLGKREPGRYLARVAISGGTLSCGVYTIDIGAGYIGSGELVNYPQCLTFAVENHALNDLDMSSTRPGQAVGLLFDWEERHVESV